MDKYLAIFKISFAQEFAYRLNFVMWRVRNIMQFFLIFFLWDTVFSSPSTQIFGYDRPKILTYVFGLIIVRSIVLSARSVDIAGEVSRGDLSNYLVKPINYIKYWLTRDLSSKLLNLSFAMFEAVLLFIVLKPPFFLQTEALQLTFFVFSIFTAILLFFLLMFLFSMFALWYPDQAWGASFLLFIFVDFLGGGVFPLDVLPVNFQNILYLTPFPYLLFSPLQIYLGKLDTLLTVRNVLIGAIWVAILSVMVNKIWRLGLKVYRSEGR